MRFKSNRGLGLPRLVIVALILAVLTMAPLPIGRTPVEAWTENRPAQTGAERGRPDGGSRGRQAVEPTGATSLAVESTPAPEAADGYADALSTRRASLIALLVGTLAVLLLLRWHLTVRGRQHYPRS